MIEVSLVPPQFVNTCWDKVVSYIEGAVEYTHGRYKAEDLYNMVVEGDHQLWVAYEGQEFKGVVLTNIMNYPQRRLLCMGFCGGVDLKDWKDPMLKLLQCYAKDVGCDAIEAFGRPGWGRVLSDYDEKATVFIKEI